MPISSMSMGSSPAVWEASTTSKSPCAWQNSPTRRRSTASPVRLEAWVQTTALVSRRRSPGRASQSSRPCRSAGRKSTAPPWERKRYRGRRTELCSQSVEMTWSPGAKSPAMAMFSAAVELGVKQTRSAGQWKSSPSKSRVS